ncbi:MAG: iron dicitrate transport regulator FecR [Alphaproteobacteria bacterium]|nr:MAG: iron dicitrate transport regulator FecR [Alphaproteobacteria bacterium]
MTIEAEADIRRKEAAEWFSRLNQRKVTTADIKDFSDWRRDPENARAFSRLEAMWDAAGTLAKSPQMAALTEEATTRSRQAAPKRRRNPSGRLIPLGAASAIALTLAVGSWSWWSAQRPEVYDTAIGEQRTVRLEDGSRIILDTDSHVAVRFTGAQRLVTLASGRVMFEVEGDPARPFLVKAGDTEVTAIGTRFDVRRAGAGAQVVLVEGQVAVRQKASPRPAWTLAPGQQVTTSAQRPAIVAVNVPAATSWTTGRLTFENTPIAVAVAEVNRYSPSPVELRDDRISSIRVSGVFDAGDVDGFVAALTDLYALEAARAPDGHLVLTGPA